MLASAKGVPHRRAHARTHSTQPARRLPEPREAWDTWRRTRLRLPAPQRRRRRRVGAVPGGRRRALLRRLVREQPERQRPQLGQPRRRPQLPPGRLRPVPRPRERQEGRALPPHFGHLAPAAPLVALPLRGPRLALRLERADLGLRVALAPARPRAPVLLERGRGAGVVRAPPRARRRRRASSPPGGPGGRPAAP